MRHKKPIIDSALHEVIRNAHDLAVSTQDRYLRDLDQWIEYAGNNPSNWTRRRASSFYTKLLERMKPQSANRLMASVAYASRWWSHLENNPSLDFAKVQAARSKDKKPQHALSAADARDLLSTCDGSPTGIRDFAMIVTGLETGMRRMSLAGMAVESSMLSPVSTSCPGTRVPLKGRDPGWVPLSDTACLALQLWLDTLYQHTDVRHGSVFRPSTWHIVGVRQTFTFRPEPMGKSTLAKIFTDRGVAAGLGPINIHKLRHTFITWRAEAGLKPHEIASITFHDVGKMLGALGGYIDMAAVGAQVRNATPPWLVELVANRARGAT